MATNQAAWLDGGGQKLRVAEAPMPKADRDGVVIRNKAVAINPVDWKIQDYGIFIKTWPTILGTDLAGDVVEVGENVKNVKKGDRVIAHSISLLNGKSEDGGFQLFSHAQAATTTSIPDEISYVDGSVLPLAIDTAAVGLYSESSKGFLGLSLPSVKHSASGISSSSHTEPETNKTIVVWGGSSSVGAVTTQLAVQSGAKVITTASKHNFDFCKKCGASEVFDYKTVSVIDDVVNAVKASSGTFAGVYDAISLPDDSYKFTLSILEKLEGGNLTVVLPPPEKVPSNVTVGNVFGVNAITHPLWADYIKPALSSGELKCLPEPLVVGNGLESIQKGLDENKKGVSAKKVVIEL